MQLFRQFEQITVITGLQAVFFPLNANEKAKSIKLVFPSKRFN
jgi:hypothetical protein